MGHGGGEEGQREGEKEMVGYQKHVFRFLTVTFNNDNNNDDNKFRNALSLELIRFTVTFKIYSTRVLQAH